MMKMRRNVGTRRTAMIERNDGASRMTMKRRRDGASMTITTACNKSSIG